MDLSKTYFCVFTLLGHLIVSSLVFGLDDAPRVRYLKEVCTVTFKVDEGTLHRIVMIKEPVAIFGTNAKVVDQATGKEIDVHNRRLHGIRYHSKVGQGEYATALLSDDRTQVLEGVFSTVKHGFFEFNHGVNARPTLRRSLEGVSDIVLQEPKAARDASLRAAFSANSVVDEGTMPAASVTAPPTTFDWGSTVASTPPNTVIPFFPGCFPQDAITHVLKMNVILDSGVVSQLSRGVTGDPTSIILANLESVFAPGKLIYLSQLNVRLEINRVILGSITSAAPLNGNPDSGTCVGATQSMENLSTWLTTQSSSNQTGYWILASNCFSGVNGVSYIGNICGRYNNVGVAAYSWPVLFHELGHGFGMSHSFENGVGTTGGLMDYGDTLYNGVSQFHPNKRVEACGFLTIVKNSACPYFAPDISTDSCGDGVLAASEQCECLDQSKTCGKCVGCRLTDTNIQCSSTDFVVRNSFSPPLLIVQPSALADPSCCIKNQPAPPKTLCGPGLLDACGAGGICTKVCRGQLYAENPNCGFDATGCLLGCIWLDACRFDMILTGNQLISAMPDGTPCESGEFSGTCKYAKCWSGGSFPPSLDPVNAPTGSPFYNPVDTTNSPTRYPSKSTKKPTRFPTVRTSRDEDSTMAPTDPAASIDPVARCAKVRNKRSCKQKKCSWCARVKSCKHGKCR